MHDCNDVEHRKAAKLASLAEKDLLALLARERGVTSCLQSRRSQLPSARVFLSYARPDRRIVGDLCKRLAADGLKPWMDVKCLLPGQNWAQTVRQAIQNAEFFVTCLSHNSVNRRGFLQRELRLALDILDGMLPSDIYLIPARLDDCGVPDALRSLQWVDLFRSNGYERLVAAICEGLKRRCTDTSDGDRDEVRRESY